MRIDYIKLKNYRCYIDQTIVLGVNENKKNFTIIQGANGTGKSSIMNAITWCFYGEEVHLEKKLKGLPIFNTEVFDKAKNGDIIEVKVEIQLVDKKNKKHLFSRSINHKKNSQGKEEVIKPVGSNKKNNFEYLREEGNQFKKIENPSHYLEQIMPANIKEYFFFDGEKLETYFTKKSKTAIRKAVFDISQISILEKLTKRLKREKKKLLEKHSGELGPKENDLRKQMDDLDGTIKGYEDSLEEDEIKKNKATDLEEELSDILLNNPDTSELEKKRQWIKEEIEKKGAELKNNKKEKFEKLLTVSFSIFLYKAIKSAKDIIDSGIEKGKWPPDARKDFVEHLLRTNKCICGSDLSEPEKRKLVEDLLERVSGSSDITNEIINMQSALRRRLESLAEFDKEQLEISNKIKSNELAIEGLTQENDELMEQLGSSSSIDVRQIKTQLQKVRESKEEAIGEISKIEIRLSDCKNNHSKLSRELARLVQKKAKNEKLGITANFLDICIDYLEELRNDIMHEVREKIEGNTKKQFLGLLWNPEVINDVSIDEEYNMSVTHCSGREGIGTLSKGQMQALALSFMAALNKVSGFEIPIVIDTPLGRISREPKLNIAKNLPNYLDGTQVTMLVTEEEYTPEVRERLKARVDKEYKIHLKRATCAEIISYE